MFETLLDRPMRTPSSRRETPSRKRFSPGVETLEGREAPAVLTFLSPAGIYGTAALNGGQASAQVRSLTSSNSGNIASRSSGWSNAYASLTNYSGSSYYKTVTATTSVYARSTSLESRASAWSTEGQGAFNSVRVRIDPVGSERTGQSVKVTLTPSFVSTIGPNNQGSATNSYNFYVNGGDYLSGSDTSRGTQTFQRTLTLNSTIGSTFTIAFLSKSRVGASNSIGNVASMQFSVGLSVSAGSGGQYSAPPAPNRPTWWSAGGNDIYLRWNDVAGETRYVVQYWKPSTSSWVTLSMPNAGSTQIKITNGRGFYFRIGAQNSIGTTYSQYVLASY